MFVVAIVLAVIFVILVALTVPTGLAKRKGSDEAASAFPWLMVGSGTALLFVLIASFFASWAPVSTRNVGVVTTFGRPVGQLDNGPHFIAPWEGVTEMPATIQTETFADNPHHDCVNVRIAYQITACVDVSQQWRIRESAVDGLYQNYKSFDGVRDSVVNRKLFTALNDVFKNYDPFAMDANGQSTTTSLAQLSQNVNKEMSQAIGSQVEVLNTFISLVHLDSATQQKLNQLQQQVAATRIANQAQQTAAAQAAANQKLQASVSNDPNVLVSKCMDLMQDMINKGQSVPPGFNCWPGGSNTPVIAQTGR